MSVASAGMISVWRIATKGTSWLATDLSGKGAAVSGGRWNLKNDPVVYSASSIALACLETVVHLNAQSLPINRYAVEIQIPVSIWEKAYLPSQEELPKDWFELPAGTASAEFGSQWVHSSKSLLMVIPSVIVPMERNILINPLHPDIETIKAFDRGLFKYDERLRQTNQD